MKNKNELRVSVKNWRNNKPLTWNVTAQTPTQIVGFELSNKALLSLGSKVLQAQKGKR